MSFLIDPTLFSRRKTNVSMVLLMALASLVGYYSEGYIWHSSLIFELSYLAAIVVALVAAFRIRTKNLATLLLSSALVSAIVEHTNISSGLLAYAGSPDVSLFIVSGWMLLMVVILQLSDLSMKWLPDLGIFKNMRGWNSLPFVLTCMIFAFFFYWEGYLAIAGRGVLGMYAVMAVIGLIYAWKHSIEWNSSIMVVSLAVGGYMELLGSLAGFWHYHFMEPLAISFVLTWPINTWAIHGLTYLIQFDLRNNTERPQQFPKDGRNC